MIPKYELANLLLYKGLVLKSEIGRTPVVKLLIENDLLYKEELPNKMFLTDNAEKLLNSKCIKVAFMEIQLIQNGYLKDKRLNRVNLVKENICSKESICGSAHLVKYRDLYYSGKELYNRINFNSDNSTHILFVKGVDLMNFFEPDEHKSADIFYCYTVIQKYLDEFECIEFAPDGYVYVRFSDGNIQKSFEDFLAQKAKPITKVSNSKRGEEDSWVVKKTVEGLSSLQAFLLKNDVTQYSVCNFVVKPTGVSVLIELKVFSLMLQATAGSLVFDLNKEDKQCKLFVLLHQNKDTWCIDETFTKEQKESTF